MPLRQSINPPVPTKWVAAIILTVLLTVFGFVLNPLVGSVTTFWWVVFHVELIVGLVWAPIEFWRAARKSAGLPDYDGGELEPMGRPTLGAGALLIGILLLWANLYRERWVHPVQSVDDADYYAAAPDAATAARNLLVPYREHFVASARLTTLFATQVEESKRQQAAASISLVLFLPAPVLVFLLARREWRSEVAGLSAAALFSLSPAYREIVFWYSASQWLVAFHLLLVALLLVSRVPPTGARLVAVCAIAFVGPFNFSHGILIGPIASMWIGLRTEVWRSRSPWWTTLAPTMASLAAGTVIVPLLLHSFQGESYQRTKMPGFEFHPWDGLVYSVRLFLDVLIARNLGWQSFASAQFYAVALASVLVFLRVVLRARPQNWRLLAPLGMMLLAYGAMVPFRTWVAYGAMVDATRYQLIPHLGFVLFLVGVVAEWRPNRFTGAGRLRLTHGLFVIALALLLAWRHDGLK